MRRLQNIHNLHIIRHTMTDSKPQHTPEGSTSVSRDDMYKTIAEAWKLGLFRQEDAAVFLGINQGQISRIVRGDFKRPAGKAAHLFAYAKDRLNSHAKPDNIAEMRNKLIHRLLETWDETLNGAQALMGILDGVQRLRETTAPTRTVASTSTVGPAK